MLRNGRDLWLLWMYIKVRIDSVSEGVGGVLCVTNHGEHTIVHKQDHWISLSDTDRKMVRELCVHNTV